MALRIIPHLKHLSSSSSSTRLTIQVVEQAGEGREFLTIPIGSRVIISFQAMLVDLRGLQLRVTLSLAVRWYAIACDCMRYTYASIEASL